VTESLFFGKQIYVVFFVVVLCQERAQNHHMRGKPTIGGQASGKNPDGIEKSAGIMRKNTHAQGSLQTVSR